MRNHLELVATFIENVYQVISVINKKFDAIESITLMKLSQKPSYRLFCGH